MNRTLTLTLVALLVIGATAVASAQERRLNISVQPQSATIFENFNASDQSGPNGFQYRVDTMALMVDFKISDQFELRGRSTLPAFQLNDRTVTYRYTDAGNTRDADQPYLNVDYRDFDVELRLRPVQKIAGLYGLIGYSNTMLSRNVTDLRTGVIVQNVEVIQTYEDRSTHNTLLLGGGIKHEFRRQFEVGAEASVSPILSNLTRSTTYSTNLGDGGHGKESITGKGARVSLVANYFITKRIGIGGGMELRRFTHQNAFERNNHIQPLTTWRQYNIAVTTHF